MGNINMAKWLLRIGLAFTLVYAAIASMISPADFADYVPGFVTQFIQLNLFLTIFSIGQIVLGVWLLSAWKGRWPALISFLLMASIMLFNFNAMLVVFRDVAIACAALALAVLEN
jgi:hypothetical protein